MDFAQGGVSNGGWIPSELTPLSPEKLSDLSFPDAGTSAINADE